MDYTIDPLQSKINEARSTLKEESRRAIDASNWKSIILDIGKNYSPEQLDDLKTETDLLLCGISRTEDYPKELQERMLIPKEEVNLLISELDKQIFKKIQSDLENRLFNVEKLTPKPKTNIVLDPRFISMPNDIQEAIARSDWRNKLYEISKSYKINIEQKGILEDLVVRLIQNGIHPDKFEFELTSKITIPREEINNLIKEINETILKKIRESMEGGNTSSRQQVVSSMEGNNSNKKQVVSSEEEEVPLPPYATPIKKIETAFQVSRLMIKEEIPIKNEVIEPKESTTPISEIKENIFVSTNNKDGLKGEWSLKEPLFNPKENESPKIISKSMIEEKLKSVTMSDHTVSDYTIPKITNPSSTPTPSDSNPSIKSHDPYREEF